MEGISGGLADCERRERKNQSLVSRCVLSVSLFPFPFALHWRACARPVEPSALRLLLLILRLPFSQPQPSR